MMAEEEDAMEDLIYPDPIVDVPRHSRKSLVSRGTSCVTSFSIPPCFGIFFPLSQIFWEQREQYFTDQDLAVVKRIHTRISTDISPEPRKGYRMRGSGEAGSKKERVWRASARVRGVIGLEILLPLFPKSLGERKKDTKTGRAGE